MNAAREKEDPIVIGNSAKPSVSRNYNSATIFQTRKHGNSEIMNTVLSKLNKRMLREKRKIILFMIMRQVILRVLKGSFPTSK